MTAGCSDKMGVMQNIVDWFYMKTGKEQKVYPVTVEKWKIVDGEPVEVGTDLGRTTVDDNGNKQFELYGEELAEGKVKYEDIKHLEDGSKKVSICLTDRENLAPLNKEFKTEESFEGSDLTALEYCVKAGRMKDWVEESIEESYKIAETDDKKWWQADQVKWAIIMISTGLFFIFLGVANGEFYLKPFGERIAELTEALNSANVQTGGS